MTVIDGANFGIYSPVHIDRGRRRLPQVIPLMVKYTINGITWRSAPLTRKHGRWPTRQVVYSVDEFQISRNKWKIRCIYDQIFLNFFTIVVGAVIIQIPAR